MNPRDDAGTIDRMAVIIVRESWDKVLRSGSVFRKLTDEEAYRIAPIVLEEKRRNLLELEYLMAVICQECRFDWRVYNPNGRDPAQIATTDYGMAQRSGAVLLAEAAKSGVPVQDLIDRAMSPEWAVPWMARRYRYLLDRAEAFPGTDRRYAATMAYNKGEVGASAILRNDKRIIDAARAKAGKPLMNSLEWLLYKMSGHRHARKVMGWTEKFRAELASLPA